MDKHTVISHFGTASQVTKLLGLSSGAVSQWGPVPPLLQQYRIERITGGALKANDPQVAELLEDIG